VSTTTKKLQEISDKLVEAIWKETKLHFVIPLECPGCSPQKFAQFISIIRKLVTRSQSRYVEVLARRKKTHGNVGRRFNAHKHA